MEIAERRNHEDSVAVMIDSVKGWLSSATAVYRRNPQVALGASVVGAVALGASVLLFSGRRAHR